MVSAEGQQPCIGLIGAEAGPAFLLAMQPPHLLDRTEGPFLRRTMERSPDIRWKQRFQNFDRAFVLLREALEEGPERLNQLEREGVVQRFEYCFELAWKTVKDFMEYSGVVFSTVTPRQVLKDAFAAKVLSDGQVWIDMLDHRNLLSHTYSRNSFEVAVNAIHARYLPAMAVLHDELLTKTLP